MPSGYLGTPLAKKLGIKPKMHFILHGAPDYYFSLFDNWPEDAIESVLPNEENIDFIHIFCHDLDDLISLYDEHKKALKKNGMMWISWPKKSSKIKTDIDSNNVRSYILDNGLVDVKVASIDDTWSALKAVYRVKDR